MRSFYLRKANRARLEWPETAAVSGVQSWTLYRTLGSARVERKEPTTYWPLSARCGAWLFKETALGLRSGESRLKRRNLGTSLFPENVGVKENRNILLCKRTSGDSEICEI